MEGDEVKQVYVKGVQKSIAGQEETMTNMHGNNVHTTKRGVFLVLVSFY